MEYGGIHPLYVGQLPVSSSYEGDSDLSKEIVKRKTIGDVYRIIYDEKQSSRQNIAAKLGLSLPTVTDNLNRLQRDGYIYTAGVFESTGGRKPNILQCVPNARYSLGINITQSHLSIVIIDLSITIIASTRIRRLFSDTDAYYSEMSREIETLIDEYQIPRNLLLGIGISLPVIVNADNKTISYATVIHIADGIYERISRHLAYPFLFFNDASSAGLAESWISGEDEDMVYLSLGNSVGGATMNGKYITTGNNNRASEFGHMCIIPSGRPCYCGQRGCLNAYCSEKVLSDFTDGNLKQFFEELEENKNPGYQNLFNEYLDYLAIAINNLRMCYDCNIILGGNVGAYMSNHIETLRKKALALNPYEENGDFIRVCHYRKEAMAVGAAIYHINQFIKNM